MTQYMPDPDTPSPGHDWINSSTGIDNFSQNGDYGIVKTTGASWVARDLSEFSPGTALPTGTNFTLSGVQLKRLGGSNYVSGIYFGVWRSGQMRYVAMPSTGLVLTENKWTSIPNLTTPVTGTGGYLGSATTEAAVKVILYFQGSGRIAMKGFRVYDNGVPDDIVLDDGDVNFTSVIPNDSLEVQFNHEDPNEAITEFIWDWGDPSADTSGWANSLRTPKHTFPTAGTYTVNLYGQNTIQPDNGANIVVNKSHNRSKTITVPSGSFTANFTMDGSYLDIDVSAASSVGALIETYAWDWGDGSPITYGVNASHTFATGGTYPVKLTISNHLGQSSSKTINFVAVSIPLATVNFSVERSFLSVAFSSHVPATGGTFSWNFGDSGTSSAANPVHVYAAPGQYIVTMVYTDGGGPISASKVLTVDETYTTLDRLIDYLRLEVELPHVANTPYNLIENPNGELGGFFWNTPYANAKLQGMNTDPPSTSPGLVEGWKFYYLATGDGVSEQTMYSDLFRCDAGQAIRGSLLVPYMSQGYYRVRFDYYNSSGVYLSSSGYSGYQTAAAGSFRTAVQTAPASTFYASMKITFYYNTSGATIPNTIGFWAILNRIMVATATNINNLTNPTFDTDILGWDATQSGITKVWNGATPRLRGIATAAGNMIFEHNDFIGVITAESFTASAKVYAAGATRSVDIEIRFYDSAFAYVSSLVTHGGADSAGGVTYTVSGTVPSSVSYCKVRVTVLSAANTEIHDIDDVHLDGYPRWFAGLSYTESENWMDILDPTYEIRIGREELSLGEMDVAIRDSSLDPVEADIIRVGRGIRLRAQTEDSLGNIKFEPIFTGEIANAQVQYLRENAYWVEGVGSDEIVNRTNRFTNPSFENNMTGWAGNTLLGGRDAITSQIISNDRALYGSFSAKITVPAGSKGFWWGQNITDHVSGDPVSYAFDVWVPSGAPAITPETAFVGRGDGITTFNAWTRISLNHAGPTGTSLFFGIGFLGAISAPFTFYVDGAICEWVNAVGTFFSGYTASNPGGYSYRWVSGTDTRSQEYIPAVATVPGHYETNPEPKAIDIQVQAFDILTKYANQPESRGVQHISDLPFILEGKDGPYEVNGSSSQITSATVVSKNESASTIDQVAITRDTDHGYAWVSRSNIFKAYDAAHMDNTVVYSFDESDYTGIDVNFNPDNIINDVKVTYLRYDVSSGETTEVVYGPYRDSTSYDNWGLHTGEFTIHGIGEANVAAWANDILTQCSTPQVRVNALAFPIIYAEDLVPGKALVDLYDLVNVKYAAKSIDHDVRVVAIEHEITLEGWNVAIGFNPDGSIASPQVAPSINNVDAPNWPYFTRINSTNQSITASTWTPVNFGASDQGNTSTWSPTTPGSGLGFDIHKDGIYMVLASITFTGAGANTRRQARLSVNGTIVQYDQKTPPDANNVTMKLAMVRHLTEGDNVLAEVWHNHSASINILGGIEYTQIQIVRIADYSG